MGGGDFLLLKDFQKLVECGIPPEQEIVTRHFCYFGPLMDALLEHIGDKTWFEALKWAAKDAAEMLKDDPGLKFERWGQDLGPEAVHMISGMTALDPKVRLTIEQVLDSPFWDEDS